jgi:hypothetical protein
MMGNDGFKAVLDLRYRNPEAAMHRIAAELGRIASGCDYHDAAFLGALARAIDPHQTFPAKLAVARQGRGSPPDRPNRKIGDYAIARIEVLNEKVEAAVAATQERFGVARSTAMEALAEARTRAADNPAEHAHLIEEATFFRDWGFFDMLCVGEPSD